MAVCAVAAGYFNYLRSFRDFDDEGLAAIEKQPGVKIDGLYSHVKEEPKGLEWLLKLPLLWNQSDEAKTVGEFRCTAVKLWIKQPPKDLSSLAQIRHLKTVSFDGPVSTREIKMLSKLSGIRKINLVFASWEESIIPSLLKMRQLERVVLGRNPLTIAEFELFQAKGIGVDHCGLSDFELDDEFIKIAGKTYPVDPIKSRVGAFLEPSNPEKIQWHVFVNTAEHKYSYKTPYYTSPMFPTADKWHEKQQLRFDFESKRQIKFDAEKSASPNVAKFDWISPKQVRIEWSIEPESTETFEIKATLPFTTVYVNGKRDELNVEKAKGLVKKFFPNLDCFSEPIESEKLDYDDVGFQFLFQPAK